MNLVKDKNRGKKINIVYIVFVVYEQHRSCISERSVHHTVRVCFTTYNEQLGLTVDSSSGAGFGDQLHICRYIAVTFAACMFTASMTS